MSNLYKTYHNFLNDYTNKGLSRQLVKLQRIDKDDKKSSRFIRVHNQSFINLSTNDYLGLSTHPYLAKRASEWTMTYGTGTGSSRLVTGNLSLFAPIERKIAALKQQESALVMGSGFQSNATILKALFDIRVLKEKPLIFSDRLNHASIHFGCAAANTQQIRYKHCDIEHLKMLLTKYKNDTNPKFIITETIFSMDGDIAPLEKISHLAKQHNAMLIVDDAHSVGTTPGLALVDVIIGTFSKAFGSYGSYIAANDIIIEYLKNRCHGLIYSTALPPPILGAIDAALDLYPNMASERKHLTQLSTYLRTELLELGINIANSQSHIIPLILADNVSVMTVSQKLKQHSFWATPIRPPTVPAKSSRIRFSLTSALAQEDIKRLLSVLLPIIKKNN